LKLYLIRFQKKSFVNHNFSRSIFLGQQITAQVIVQDDTIFNTKSQLLLANELFESGEPFAEALGYDLDPMDLNFPDSISYTAGVENHEYSRYILGTLTACFTLRFNMIWLEEW
jgi:hypothetical protein